MTNTENDITKYFKYKYDPELFITQIFNAKLFSWQQEICENIKNSFLTSDEKNLTFKVAIAGANNTGKSWFGRMLLLWHFCTHENSRNYVLTNSEKQTKRTGFGKMQADIGMLFKSENVICGESIYFKSKFGGTNGIWDIGYFGITSKQSSLTGLHDPFMFFFFDEAINFNDEIWTALETMCASGRVIVYASANPTSNEGTFRQIFRNKADKIDNTWHTHHISFYNLPESQYNKEWADTLIAKHGISSPIVRSAVFGQFPDEMSTKRFPRKLILEAMEREGKFDGGVTVMGVDVSEDSKFGASSAICIRQGMNILFWEQFNQDYETFKGILMRIIADRCPNIVAIDANGCGFGLYSEVRRMVSETIAYRGMFTGGINVVKVKGHKKAHQRGMFTSRRDELFWIASEWIMSGEASMPYDSDMVITLSAIEFDSIGKTVTVISKKDLKKKLGEIGVRTMDRLDSFIYTFAEQENNETYHEDYNGKYKSRYNSIQSFYQYNAT